MAPAVPVLFACIKQKHGSDTNSGLNMAVTQMHKVEKIVCFSAMYAQNPKENPRDLNLNRIRMYQNMLSLKLKCVCFISSWL